MIINDLLRFRRRYKLIFGYFVVKQAIYKFILNRIIPKPRTQDKVIKDYDPVWRGGFSKLNKLDTKPIAHLLNGGLIFVRNIDRRKYEVEYISEMLNSLRPKSFLEMGCGDGFKILALAVLNPDVETWEGMELTEGGVEAGKRLLKDPPLEALVYVTGRDREEILQRINHSTIRFSQGDMTQLSYSNDSFECVFTCGAIEQIPRDYLKAFKEANRITSKTAVFLEGFKEAQQDIFQRIYQYNVDYFRFSYKVAQEAGLRILAFHPSAINKVTFSNGWLLCEKGK